MDTFKKLSALALLLILVLIHAFMWIGMFARPVDGPPAAADAPADYPVWHNSANPDATPPDYLKTVDITHMRRLHLFRPDLIPYPIAVEVCC